VLAAGYATRLYPLTRDRPKPLLEVGGTPILTRIVGRLSALPDLSEIIVISNARFAAHFERWRDALETALPVRILNDGTRAEDDRLGAVGDTGFALEQVPVAGEDWLLVAGDNLLEFALAPIVAALRETGLPTLVVRDTGPRTGPSPYNEVVLAGNEVKSFREKPDDPRSPLAAIALYAFPADVARDVARFLALQRERGQGVPDAPGHFISWLVEQRAVAATPLPGTWFDIGSLETLAAARAALGD